MTVSSEEERAAEDSATAISKSEAPVVRTGLLGGLQMSWNTLFSAVPVYVGLALVWLYFDWQTNGIFIGARNLSEMAQEYSYKPVLALGIVLVLLLGEIDLSVGYVVLLSLSTTAVFSQSDHLPAGVAIVGAIALCTVVGLIQGFFIAWVRIASFVVTLAGFLIVEGFAYHLVQGSTINVFDPFIQSLGSSFLPVWLSWVIAAVIVAGYLGFSLLARANRTRHGLPNVPMMRPILTTAGIALGLVIVVAGLNSYRGVPLSLALLGAFLLIFWYMTTRTRFGRHLYAVGGNIEAARRAGINTTALRWVVFGISGMMAGVAGVMLVGYTTAASTTTAGPDLLLDAISIAVIGGVSLTGGRGSVWSVVLGGLLIASIDSGLNLMATDPNYVYVIKGTILLAAILIDTLGKRGSVPAFLKRR